MVQPFYFPKSHTSYYLHCDHADLNAGSSYLVSMLLSLFSIACFYHTDRVILLKAVNSCCCSAHNPSMTPYLIDLEANAPASPFLASTLSASLTLHFTTQLVLLISSGDTTSLLFLEQDRHMLTSGPLDPSSPFWGTLPPDSWLSHFF